MCLTEDELLNVVKENVLNMKKVNSIYTDCDEDTGCDYIVYEEEGSLATKIDLNSLYGFLGKFFNREIKLHDVAEIEFNQKTDFFYVFF